MIFGKSEFKRPELRINFLTLPADKTFENY